MWRTYQGVALTYHPVPSENRMLNDLNGWKANHFVPFTPEPLFLAVGAAPPLIVVPKASKKRA